MSFRINPNEMLGKGRLGVVYLVEDNKAVKICRDSLNPNFHQESYDRFYEGLKYEYDMQKRLYSDAIFVPEPFGIFDVIVDIKGKERHVPGFVMEKIEGKCLMEMGSCFPGINYFQNKHKSEVIKAEKLGYFSRDWKGNAIYNFETDNIVLIDFQSWGLEDEL